MTIRLDDIPPCPDCGEASYIELVTERCIYWELVEKPDGTIDYEYRSDADGSDERIIRYGCCTNDLPEGVEEELVRQLGLSTFGMWNFDNTN